jgi:hypothetical protein
MSYFVFGTVGVADAAARVEAILRETARRAGVHVVVGER